MSIQAVTRALEQDEPFSFERIGPIANRAMNAMLTEALQFRTCTSSSDSKEVKSDER